ncbi:hypothetical protein PR048_028271 [Dryococelus australis]|uniref:Uncharacterized protein n=1 Tax=Dryococelus australis TaxID=614101 RepID=A0ABQ9GIU2_9NEOP|nr:hypothetical protein PR048_028271 [Dryococelus australis]
MKNRIEKQRSGRRPHSIVLLAVVDVKYRFNYNDVGCNRRVFDGGVFSRSTLGQAFLSNLIT